MVYDRMIFGEKINHIAWHICYGEVGIIYFLYLCLFYLHQCKKPLFCAMQYLAGVLAHLARGCKLDVSSQSLGPCLRARPLFWPHTVHCNIYVVEVILSQERRLIRRQGDVASESDPSSGQTCTRCFSRIRHARNPSFCGTRWIVGFSNRR